MASYVDTKNYFEQLAIENIAVSHDPSEGGNKKFFEVMLEEVISGITQSLPSSEAGPFIIFSGYIDRLKFKEQNIKNRELMFFVMQSAGTKDYQAHSTAKDACEEVVDSFLSRIQYDSRNDLPLFNSALDKISNSSIIPNEFKIGSTTYVGWQVAISYVVYLDLSFKPEKWNV